MDEHEMDACPAVPHQPGYIIKLAFTDVMERNRPSENAKGQLQGRGCETDTKRSVIQRVEKEETKENKRNPHEEAGTACAGAPDEQHKEQNRQHDKEKLGPLRGHSFSVDDGLIHHDQTGSAWLTITESSALRTIAE